MYPRERHILRFLARGFTYQEIAEKFKTSLASIHTHAYEIRKATGIKNTANPQECKDWMYGQADKMEVGGLSLPRDRRGPTQSQLRYMLMLANGQSVPEIAEQLALGLSTIRNALSYGCSAAGIPRRDLDAIKAYLRQRGLLGCRDPMNDPMF